MTRHTLGSRARERGYAGLVALLVAALAATGLFASLRTDAVQLQNDRRTGDALAAAKAALIGFGVQGGGPTGRPGELPCPDTNGDGLAESTCDTPASLLGLLPWKTLGIPEPRDAAGAPLWYALSLNFRWITGAVPADRRINSDTRGTLLIHGEDSSAQLTATAVAVVIAPGAAVGAQNRASVTAPNFLDATGGINNADSGAGPFISARTAAGFNDTLVYIDTTELIPQVEIRVAHEMKRLLTWYRSASSCQCYPWAASWTGFSGASVDGQNRGAFPIGARPETWAATGSAPDPERIPPLPAWLADNNWHNFVWYSVSRQASQRDAGGPLCLTCGEDTLHVNESGADLRTAVVLFTPGTRGDALRVPELDLLVLLGLTRSPANLTAYLEDAENRDAADSACPVISALGLLNPSGLVGATTCDRYVKPRSERRDRDRIQMLGVANPDTCRSAGGVLATEERCGAGWAVTNPACIAAIQKLDSCNCQAAAIRRTQPPCNNNLSNNNSECVNAIAQLNLCG